MTMKDLSTNMQDSDIAIEHKPDFVDLFNVGWIVHCNYQCVVNEINGENAVLERQLVGTKSEYLWCNGQVVRERTDRATRVSDVGDIRGGNVRHAPP